MTKEYLEYDHDPVEKCKEMWDMGGLIPLPKWEIQCPCCRSSHTLIVRQAKFHERLDSPSKYRCRISFKCTHCSYVCFFGVVVSEELYKRHDPYVIYTYNQIKKSWERE